MIGEAIAHGAGTIINAIATGRGAAFGVDLWTKAKVRLTEDPGIIEGRILTDPSEKPTLIKKAILTVLQSYGVADRYGAQAETESNIPIAKGLKSSSVAANAVVLATIAALGKKPRSDLWAVNLGVDAALEAGVTITGAFDDACASYFGNVVVTDNRKRRIVKRFEVKEALTVLFFVPRGKVYTTRIDTKSLKRFSRLVDLAYNGAKRGEFWRAMTLNGFLYSTALGYDLSPVLEALEVGALASGLSGTGPAVAAVVEGNKVDAIKERWQAREGEIIETGINEKKASIIGIE